MYKKIKKFSILTVVALVVMAAIAYFSIPWVRYLAIPLTGGTKAPSVGFESGVDSRDTALQLSPGLFANTQHSVTTIEQVPEQNGWINAAPLNIWNLQQNNHVVLFDFWTYSNINCLRDAVFIEQLWERYKDYGLVVIGVHSPVFHVEKLSSHINSAVKQAGITYPVLTDGDKVIWKLFGNHFWPAKYLVDPRNRVVFTQFGEGDYRQVEEAVRQTLVSAGWIIPDYAPLDNPIQPEIRNPETPELYAGMKFLRFPFANEMQPNLGKTTSFKLPDGLERDQMALSGAWNATQEFQEASSLGEVWLKYLANTPYVMLDSGKSPLYVEVLWDEQPIPELYRGSDIVVRKNRTYLKVTEPRLYYPLANHTPYGEHVLQMKVPPGLRFYGFSFGTYS